MVRCGHEEWRLQMMGVVIGTMLVLVLSMILLLRTLGHLRLFAKALLWFDSFSGFLGVYLVLAIIGTVDVGRETFVAVSTLAAVLFSLNAMAELVARPARGPSNPNDGLLTHCRMRESYDGG